MVSINDYRFCLNIIRKNKDEFNVFDVIHLLDIYFDYVSFYPFVCRDLILYSSHLGIKNITKNFEVNLDIFSGHYLSWGFND